MSLFKFSFIFLLMATQSFASFSDSECLQSNFEVEVSHKGFPFGLLENKIKVEKEGCVVNVEHTKFKYYKRNWKVDVCRGPVHIKQTTGAVTVLKRNENCETGRKDEFCKEYQTIKTLLQDDGLIFAEGEKDQINSDHGRIYCAFLLANSYLNQGIVFDRNENYENVLVREFSHPAAVKKEGPTINSEAPAQFDQNSAPESF